MSIKEKYPPDEFADIERKIEREFVETLQLRCYRERQYSEYRLFRYFKGYSVAELILC